jgi:MFS transporter, FSR family, fosmidomycin resistance protein
MAAVSAGMARNAKVLALIGSGHALSHFYALALPPLFPLLRDEFDVGYTALGLLVTLLNVSTGVAQIPVGFLVDRVGARALLLAGLAIMGASFTLIGFAPGYAAMLALVVVAGIGNSVFHPADYVILSSSVEPRWLGRAFSIHTFTGNVGFMLAPVTMILLTALFGWRGAVVATGALSLAVMAALVLFGGLLRDEARPKQKARQEAGGPAGGGRLLLSPPILLLFLFYVTLAMITSGVQSFSVTALVDFHGIDLAAANTVLTAFLVASAVGVLVGGFVADRTRRHALVAAVALGLAAVLILPAALVPLPAALLVAVFGLAGLVQSTVRPARDMMVRAVTPPGATGRVFAFVMTGLNVGAAITPVLFGLILDLGSPRWVFVLLAAFFVLSLTMAVTVGWVSAARPAAARAGEVAAG